MNINKCEHCKKQKSYTVKDISMSSYVRGHLYQYTGKEARCVTCGNIMYSPEVVKYNMNLLNELDRPRRTMKVIEVMPKPFV